jgi:hypothetical protein
MKMMNKYHDLLRRELYKLRNSAKNAERQRYWQGLIDYLEAGDLENMAMIEEALQGFLRNSEFPGDWVGRPDDDFDH